MKGLGKRRDGKCTELKRACRVNGDVSCGRELLRRLRGRKWFRKGVRFGKSVRGSV